MIEALIQVAQTLGPTCSVIGAIVGVLALRLADLNSKNIEKLDRKLSENDLAILRSKIKERADRCLDNGFVTEEELAELESLYDCYKNLGGNSFIVTLMEKVNKLEVK